MTMIQIRNVPEEWHRELKARAAKRGLTLSDYLLRMVERELEKPTIEELTERIRQRAPVKLSIAPEAIIRELRDEMG